MFGGIFLFFCLFLFFNFVFYFRLCGEGVQSMWSNVYSLKLYPSRKYKRNEPKHSRNTQFSNFNSTHLLVGKLKVLNVHITSLPLEPWAHAVAGGKVERQKIRVDHVCTKCQLKQLPGYTPLIWRLSWYQVTWKTVQLKSLDHFVPRQAVGAW